MIISVIVYLNKRLMYCANGLVIMANIVRLIRDFDSSNSELLTRSGRFDSFFLANRLELLKSLYNLNTKSNTLMPSLKITLYNKMQQKGNAIRIIGKEF